MKPSDMRVAYADESGTDGNTPCYTIGVVSVQADRLEDFERYFARKKTEHGVHTEAKWTRVRSSHGLTNLALASLHSILNSETASFDAIVVNKSEYQNWRILGSESAFYRTYTYLLRDIVRRTRVTTEVYIDDRSDAYPKQHEVVETIGNHMLARLQRTGRLKNVHRVNSHDYLGIQLADLLTGAVNAAHLRHLKPGAVVNPGKALTIERMAQLVGWDDLCYDTMPSPRFNIWHFPREYRAVPATKPVTVAGECPFVTPEEMAHCLTRG